MNYFLIRLLNKINKKFYYLKGYILFGKRVYIESGVKFIGIQNISIGNNCKFYAGSKIVANSGKVIIKDNVQVNSYTFINAAG
jgi:acetyltransferase-like isoleucine patch superfamily enzyme